MTWNDGTEGGEGKREGLRGTPAGKLADIERAHSMGFQSIAVASSRVDVVLGLRQYVVLSLSLFLSIPLMRSVDRRSEGARERGESMGMERSQSAK